jgi:hypothetical protein
MRLSTTMRGAMAAVALAAVLSWAWATAERVREDRAMRYLWHLVLQKPRGGFVERHQAPFWPRYWRRLLGQSWPGNYKCPCLGELRPNELSARSYLDSDKTLLRPYYIECEESGDSLGSEPHQ